MVGYYDVVRTTAPLIGSVKLKVERSPTAPETGVMVVSNASKVNSGVVVPTVEPLFAMIVMVTIVPSRASVSVVEIPLAPKSA